MTEHWLDYETFWSEAARYRDYDYSWVRRADPEDDEYFHPKHKDGTTVAIEGYPRPVLERGSELNDGGKSPVALNLLTCDLSIADPARDTAYGRCYICCSLLVEGMVLGTVMHGRSAHELDWSLDAHRAAMGNNGLTEVWRPYVDAGLGERIYDANTGGDKPTHLEPNTYYMVQATGHNYLIIGYDVATDLCLTLEAAPRDELAEGEEAYGGVGHRGIGRVGFGPPPDWVERLTLEPRGEDPTEDHTWAKHRGSLRCLVKLNLKPPVLRYPLDLAADSTPHERNAEFLYEDTEQRHEGGYYPVGLNTVWHGGLHLRAWRGAPVRACTAGEVVAARLAPEEHAWGTWGSNNFVLTRHHYEGLTYFMLFMHLDSSDGKVLDELVWLQSGRTDGAETLATIDPVEVEGELVVGGDPNAQLTPNFSLWEFPAALGVYRVHLQLLAQLQQLRESCGSAVNVAWIELSGQACEVTSSSPLLATYAMQQSACGEGLTVSTTVSGAVSLRVDPGSESCEADPGLRDELAQGKVVTLSAPVYAGDLLGWVGEYGAEDEFEPQIHWEVFSESNVSNLFEGWQTVSDTDNDFNMDCASIMNLFADAQGEMPWDSDELLTADELIRFFQAGGSGVESLRRHATFFVSEWGIDVEQAIPELLSWWDRNEGDLQRNLEHYQWWDKVAAGVLPLSRHVFHFHPVAFLADLHQRLQGE